MACVIVPAIEAVAVTAAAQIIAHQAKKVVKSPLYATGSEITEKANRKLEVSRKLMWLAKLLLGGSFLLIFEHVWHGEIVPWFPFFTAAASPETASVMLHEMMTVGVTMSVLVTLVWSAMLIVSALFEKREKAVLSKEGASA